MSLATRLNAGAQGLCANGALRRRNCDGARTAVGGRMADGVVIGSARKAAAADSHRARAAAGHALRRESAPGRGALYSRGIAGGGACGREATSGKRTFVQQSGGSGFGVGAGEGISPAGGGDHQAQQSVRSGGAGFVARRVREGAGVRSGFGVWRGAGVQSRDLMPRRRKKWRNCSWSASWRRDIAAAALEKFAREEKSAAAGNAERRSVLRRNSI